MFLGPMFQFHPFSVTVVSAFAVAASVITITDKNLERYPLLGKKITKQKGASRLLECVSVLRLPLCCCC